MRQLAARRERRPGDLPEGERVAARHVAHGRGDDVHLAARDRRVGRHPRVVLPLGGRPLLARLVRLLDGFAHVGDGATLHAGEDLRDLVEGEGLRPRHIKGLVLETPRISQDPGGHAPGVLARDHADASVTRGPEDAPGLVGQGHEEVRIEIVAQERVRHARRLDALLRVEVRARQRERRVGGRVHERQVHDVPHPGGRRRVDEREVLVQAVLALGRGHHEEDVNAREGGARRERVLVRALHRGGTRQLRGARRGVGQETQGQAALGEEAGGGPADVAGGAGDREGGEGRGRGCVGRVRVRHGVSVPQRPAPFQEKRPGECTDEATRRDQRSLPGLHMARRGRGCSYQRPRPR